MDEGEGHSWTEEAVKLLKGFSIGLTLRVSNFIVFLIQHKNASIFGAIAGSTLAIIIAWAYLRQPKERRRRLNKRRDASTTNDGSQTNRGEASSSSSACLQNPCEQGISTQTWMTPVKITLSQSIKQQLDGGRKVTCQLLGVILEEQTPEELQDHARVRPSVVEVLLEMVKVCDLYLMTRVIDDKSEERVLKALDETGLFKTGGLNRNKVLFCGTDSGSVSFVRQLEPDWHIDTDAEKISKLSKFIRHLLHISSSGTQMLGSNVYASDALELFLGMNCL
eukprot:TRINITY_DN2958_c0_g1_i1.p1 TRINITY_DN2958_c0_g1~~TRINITY_DN2958_c0_g1_i1.p1  ORF type:complete len:279 (+),score=48.51 TRINITY_DN2958_c0_g1_i1:172-1008(+)